MWRTAKIVKLVSKLSAYVSNYGNCNWDNDDGDGGESYGSESKMTLTMFK